MAKHNHEFISPRLYSSGWAFWFNTLRPRQNGRHFADDTFNRIFVNENVRFSIEFSLKFVSKGPINNIPALVHIMARCRPSDKPLSEPMLVRSLTHIWITRPQWVNNYVSCDQPIWCNESTIPIERWYKIIQKQDISLLHTRENHYTHDTPGVSLIRLPWYLRWCFACTMAVCIWSSLYWWFPHHNIYFSSSHSNNNINIAIKVCIWHDINAVETFTRTRNVLQFDNKQLR